MYLYELLRYILRDMRARKLRSILALFGIMWGTISVVLLLALGQGFYTHNKKQIFNLTSGAIVGSPGATSIPYQGLPQGRTIHLKASDIIDLPQHITGIKTVSPLLGGWKQSSHIVYRDQQISAPIYGVTTSYDKLQKLKLLPGGRFINPIDVKQQLPVVVIGSKLKSKLFKHQTAIGKTIKLNNIPFTVIGIQGDKAQNQWQANFSYIPYTTYINLFGNQDISQFAVLPKSVNNTELVQKQLVDYFSVKFDFSPNDKQAIRIFDYNKMFEFFTWFFRAIELFLGFCGALTLGVGGISVANMMFLIVTERTHEIGLRMSLGARDYHIMLQIMLEAGVIVLFGALLGFLISWLSVVALDIVPLPDWIGKPSISLTSVIVTTAILTLVALFAGYLPARRAAKLEPVEALAF